MSAAGMAGLHVASREEGHFRVTRSAVVSPAAAWEKYAKRKEEEEREQAKRMNERTKMAPRPTRMQDRRRYTSSAAD